MVVGEKGYPIKAYVYVEMGDTWSCTDTLVGNTKKDFGKHVAVHDDTIVVSNHQYDVSYDGHAYVYKLISGTYLFIFILSTTSTCLFVII